jgi:DNA polymerase
VGYAPLVELELDATPFLPKRRTMASVERAAQGCRGCPLYLDTTQAVVGTHDVPRSLMLVGEQPGDVEDRKGEVFVGPAGGVLRNVLEELGIPVESLYMTNAVKHFKHEERGPRRLHKKPSNEEIAACHPWLEVELDLVDPKVVVALGASAARSLLGRSVTIARSRGQVFDLGGRALNVTYHPSAVLRADEPERGALRKALAHDLHAAADAAGIS